MNKNNLLKSFIYEPPDITPQLHPLSLQRLVLASISCVSEEETNVSLEPGNVFQPWVLEQLTNLVEKTYDNAH